MAERNFASKHETIMPGKKDLEMLLDQQYDSVPAKGLIIRL